MQINKIDITNFKCFTHKTFTFDKYTLLNWKNGTGKSSLIQAIVICLFDKRPDGLAFVDLLNDPSKPGKIILTFTHNASIYIVEREIGPKASSYRLFKDNELLSRTATECKEKLNKIIPPTVLSSLWGYTPLASSSVLDTKFLTEVLAEAFVEPLKYKEYFTKDRTYYSKRKKELEATINNQDVTKEEVDTLKSEIDAIDGKIKDKAFITDNEVVKAKKAKEDYATYCNLQKELASRTPEYDRETCLRLKQYGGTKDAWTSYFGKVEQALNAEKSKSGASPLAKYPKATIDALISESKKGCKCVVCGNSNFVEPVIIYDGIDNNKIAKCEKILEDKKYDFGMFASSVRYWHTKKCADEVSYSEKIDFNTILDNYNKETNNLYTELEEKRKKYDALNKDLSQISDLMIAREQWDKDTQCLNIVGEYINQAKEYFSQKIVSRAKEIVLNINPRYTDLCIKDGVYKAMVWNEDFTEEKELPVGSLSNGEKTTVALALILAIRDLFMPDLPLVMDESFVNLDAVNLEAVKEIIRKDNSQWIVVSHDERLL